MGSSRRQQVAHEGLSPHLNNTSKTNRYPRNTCFNEESHAIRQTVTASNIMGEWNTTKPHPWKYFIRPDGMRRLFCNGSMTVSSHTARCSSSNYIAKLPNKLCSHYVGSNIFAPIVLLSHTHAHVPCSRCQIWTLRFGIIHGS